MQAAETQLKQLEQAGLGVPLGLLHGRMKSDVKKDALDAFANGSTPVLVATSVVEVRLGCLPPHLAAARLGSCGNTHVGTLQTLDLTWSTHSPS